MSATRLWARYQALIGQVSGGLALSGREPERAIEAEALAELVAGISSREMIDQDDVRAVVLSPDDDDFGRGGGA